MNRPTTRDMHQDYKRKSEKNENQDQDQDQGQEGQRLTGLWFRQALEEPEQGANTTRLSVRRLGGLITLPATKEAVKTSVLPTCPLAVQHIESTIKV